MTRGARHDARPARNATGRGALVAGVAAAAALVLAVRLWMADQVATPWILIDELLYGELARSLADSGRLAVRGEPLATSVLYPALIAPAWLAESAESAYRLAKGVNVVAMSAAAVPVYAWARRLATPRAALVAAGLTLLVPGLVYTTALMTENLFFPLFLVSALAIARALEGPSAGRWALALAAVALTVATRPQGLVLGPIVVTAVVLLAALEARVDGASVRRVLSRSLAWAAVPLLVLVAVRAGAPLPLLDLAPYRGALAAGYDPLEVARWAAHNAGAVALASGVVPATATLLLAADVAARPGHATRAERVFVAVATASLLWLVLLAAATSTLDPVGIRERYAFHAVPLLLVGFVAWLGRADAGRRTAAAVAVLVPVLLLAALPLRAVFGSGSFLGDGFSLIPFWRLARVLPGDVAAAHAVLVAGAVAAGLLLVLTPRRLARIVLPVAVAAFLAGSTAAVFATVRSQALGVALQSGQQDEPAWIDAAVGPDAEVVYVSATPAEPADWVAVWQAEFWNRSVRAVLDTGGPEPSPLPQRRARVAADGRVDGAAPAYALVGEEVEVAGSLVAASGPLRLYRVEPPLRLLAP